MGDTKRGRGTFGKREQQFLIVELRKLRTSKGLSQKEIAQRLGIGQQGYQRYEAGLSLPPPDKLSMLAELFGVSTDYLLGREAAFAVKEESSYARSEEANLDAMACRLAYHEIMHAIENRPRKLAEFRKLLEDFRAR